MNLWHTLRRLHRHWKQGRRTPTPHRQAQRLMLECLEDRWLLSGFSWGEAHVSNTQTAALPAPFSFSWGPVGSPEARIVTSPALSGFNLGTHSSNTLTAAHSTAPLGSISIDSFSWG